MSRKGQQPSRRKQSVDKLENQHFINPHEYDSADEFNDTEQRKYKTNTRTKWFIGLIALFSIILLGSYKAGYEPSKLHTKIKDFWNSKLDNLKLSKHCDKAHYGRPLIQYVLIIDAGSTGSRIHIYKFNYCKENAEIEDEVFIQIKPGLSYYSLEPEKAALSLDGLLDEAMEIVPNELHRCTPITVKATAGLRLLGPDASSNILNEVHKHLERDYPFPIIDKEGVAIMDGKYEGVYAWVTVNYLLNNLNMNSKLQSTVATLDLGGGSTQIVFEPLFPQSKQMLPGDHRFDIKFSKINHILYQKSYLGFGLMEARKQIKDIVGKEYSNNEKNIVHPCLSKGFKETWISKEGKMYDLLGNASGLENCKKYVEKIFNKNRPCILESCSFDGIYQPSLTQTFKNNDIYAFSYFYDRTEPFALGDEFKLSQLKTLADKICFNDEEYFKKITGASEELRDNPNRCLDLTYIYSLLSYAYDIPDTRKIKLAKTIKNYETGWCLGAAIAILDENHFCVP